MKKHIEEGLDHKNLRENATKFNLNHRKHRYGSNIRTKETDQ